ncbi:MAG: hypothetical protein MK125_14050, partial [Dehalococcoidia bacterium]|nr:hypothetical protein [Dehalococcoidia bacterium]
GTAISAGGYFSFLARVIGGGDESASGSAYALRAAAIQEITVALNPEPKPMPRGNLKVRLRGDPQWIPVEARKKGNAHN